MIPVLLDALTIFFIVAGVALLWANLRDWRRRTVPVATPKQANIGEMTDAEIARSRTQALQCLGQAEQATSQTDKEIWLQMAEKWIELIEDAESKRRSDE